MERFQVFWQIRPAVGGTLERNVYAVTTSLLFCLSLLGAMFWVWSRGWKYDALGIAALLILSCLMLTGLHTFIHAKPRYRLPLHPVLSIWVIYFFNALWFRFVQKVQIGRPDPRDRFESARAGL
jgi:hypothetical protein